ncbi:alkaline shock response membrane anchor protein AmaP [Nocardia transvalensis]|uniref:alkaline shock response membrane anchor protein AmaP n=1 Tax=Nocardia transvalensis TaxID=37333 RepID=UPI0018937A88|nr:alkaline shock response membrane anchor protein AmaP [Nocardia transvalensis]MBF6326910.1 alkaline shock response membrane anchor protein AmaP [Nocardia transvalensis]
MSTVNRPARLNRVLLGLIGLLLTAGGGYAIAAHLGRLHWADPDAPLVPGTGAPPQWVLWSVVVGAVIVALASLRWLAAQVSRLPRPTQWRLDAPAGAGVTLLRSETAAAPVAADIESYDGVRSAVARLSGPSRAPELHLIVTAEPNADLTAVRRRILGHAVPRLRQALEVDIIPVTLEWRLADRGRTVGAR